MIIANPMYDSVFKYLMEGLEIARELLSVLLREQIKSLTVKQQKTSVELADYSIAILRMDFKLVQIPLLKNEQQPRLEQVLSVFNQQPVSENDPLQLNYTGTEEDPLIARMVHRLNRAASDEDVRTKMDMEDEVERSFRTILREKDGIIEAKEQALSEKEQTIAPQAQMITDLLQKLNQQA